MPLEQTEKNPSRKKTLVLVESPAKTKTLQSYLGAGFTVMATYGHVRDLPSKTGSVKPEEDFSLTFEVIDKNKKHLDALSKEALKSDHIILATDPDREGEAISWHVAEHLKTKKIKAPAKRISFNAITKSAVLAALEHPRSIDQDLVDAYLARLSMDYLVGFTLSPVLWRKLPGCRSAGRVQSFALRVVCDREEEIEKFQKQEYWSIKGLFQKNDTSIDASLRILEDVKLEKFSLTSETQAADALEKCQSPTYVVSGVEKKTVQRHPAAPFMTSTLQQEASRKLGLPPTVTMRLAQQLYEGAGQGEGLITYMRTDSISMTEEAVTACRSSIEKQYGRDFLAPKVRLYQKKARNAQEAHEAIRPTSFSRTPDSLTSVLSADLLKLYTLVWRRALASQMASAVFEQSTVSLKHPGHATYFKASGRICTFEGFLRTYQEGTDQPEDPSGAQVLPPVTEGEVLTVKSITPHQHFTEPPPRFTEAALIKKMEEVGVGRPSTYAHTLQILKTRSYVSVQKKQVAPTETGRVLTAFLMHFFQRYVEADFTANLEEQLDAVSRGESTWKNLLKKFWDDFHPLTQEASTLKTVDVIKQVEENLTYHLFKKEDKTCPTCGKGHLNLRLGSTGPFLGCSSYPDCRHAVSLRNVHEAGVDSDNAQDALTLPMVLGQDPDAGEEVTLRRGPYGFYFQWGEGKKPKRIAMPKSMTPEKIDFQEILNLGRFPFSLGPHPETGEEMTAGLGRFGPYVKYQGAFTSVKNIDLLLEKKIHEILDLISKKKKKPAAAPRPRKK